MILKIHTFQYPWGVVDIENAEHSDFVFLKRFLIQTHMQVSGPHSSVGKINNLTKA